MSKENVIELANLTTGYGQHVVTSHIHAVLQPGQLISLLGPNGVGKSTLLRTLGAFQPPLGGEIRVGGQPVSQMSSTQLSRIIGVVLTERPDIQNMTVRDMVSMGRSPYTGFWGRLTTDDEALVDEAMQQTGVTQLADRMINTLSDGERQKVMIAKALAQHTPIILLDEPTAFLDFPSKVEMMRLLGRLAHQMQKIIFLSTHDVEMALQLSDSLWLMTKEGITTGSPAQLAQDGTIGRFIQCEGVEFDAATLTLRVR
ncbi:MAG: ABC transporter ATP-binding protein [Bacteroidaceae bacterium]|nr:ABC transporter ATP-binding protein [Bacteroidaceae bacterium]